MIIRNALTGWGRGQLDVGWVENGSRVPVVQEFLDVVRSWDGWVTGTFYAVSSNEPTTVGDWHSDTGDGLRFVATLGITESPQEFYDFKTQVGDIVVYSKEVHRRPATPPGPRLFLSATLYGPDEEVDLSCHQLAALRGA